jgi:hypothetical protein
MMTLREFFAEPSTIPTIRGSVSNLDQHISGSRRNRKSKGCPKIQLHNSNLREVSAVETRCLKEQVRRNIERFLEDFNV